MSNLTQALADIRKNYQSYRNVALEDFDNETSYQTWRMDEWAIRRKQDYAIYTSQLFQDKKLDLSNKSSQFARALTSTNRNFSRRNIIWSGFTRDSINQNTTDYIQDRNNITLRYDRSQERATINNDRAQSDYLSQKDRYVNSRKTWRKAVDFWIQKEYKRDVLSYYQAVKQREWVQKK